MADLEIPKMIRLTLRRGLLALSLLSSISAHGTWFEGEGQALIVDGQIHEARQLAIRDALLSLMYQGGASVNALQIVKQGILEKDTLLIRSNGEVHDMHLLKESIQDQYLKVTVSADIYPLGNCVHDTYAKTLFVGPFELQKREHAQLGGIYRAPEEVSRRLFYRFKEHSQEIDARHLMTRRIAFNDRYSNDIERQILTIARDISNKYDVQYILFGSINDMSSYNETKTDLLLFSSTVKQRNYQVRLYVIDGINEVTVLRKNYSGHREWPFDVTMKLDVTGETFWSSDYGKMVDAYIDQAVSDVQEALYCRPSLATVVSVYDDKLVINLGQVNGIARGDKFKLIQQRFINEQASNIADGIFNPSDTEFTVIALQSDRAILKTDSVSGMANVQIRDLLLPLIDDSFSKTIYEY